MSLNSQVHMSQMNVGVRYWNNRKNINETHYFDFDSKFMRRPNADFGPQVNWNALILLDKKLVSENLIKTVNIGSCAQHAVHGALKIGTKYSEFDTDKILKSMFWLFESLPARGDVYLKEGISGKFPLT